MDTSPHRAAQRTPHDTSNRARHTTGAAVLLLSACATAPMACAPQAGPALTEVAPALDGSVGLDDGTTSRHLAEPWQQPSEAWNGTAPLSAEAALRCALANNRALRRTLAEADRRRAAFADAQLPPNPTLNAAVGAPLDMGVIPVLATLSAQLDWLWKRESIAGDAEAQLRSLLLEAAAMVAATVVETRTAYVEAASSVEQSVLARKDAEVAARVLAAEQASFGAGESTGTAVARARMNAAEAANRAMEAEVAAVNAKTRLLEAIGRGDHALGWTTVAQAASAAAAECGIAAPSAHDEDDALLRLVRERRMDIRAAEARVASAEARAALAAASRLPSLFLGGGWERDMEGDSAAMVMLESQLPVFNDGRYRVAAAMAEAEMARIDADRVWQRAVIDARRALADVAAAEHHAATLRGATLAAFEDAQRLLARMVEAGEGRGVDLWRSEHQRNHILLQLARAERDRSLAALSFERALAGGRLPSMQPSMAGSSSSGGMGAAAMPDFGFTALETME
jgi:outer membrane protein TolC